MHSFAGAVARLVVFAVVAATVATLAPTATVPAAAVDAPPAFDWAVPALQFNRPAAVAEDGAGNVYVADAYNNRVQKFTSAGVYVAQWGTVGSGDGQFDGPQGVAVDGAGNVYVADTNNNRVQKFTTSARFSQ